MGRQNIYKALSTASVMPPAMITDLMQFLIKNHSLILPSVKKNDAFKTRISGQSIMSEITQRLTVLGKDQAYSLIRIPSKSVALPEVADFTFVPFDVLQMKEIVPSSSTTLSHIPELNDKMVINVTGITRSNGDFSDATQFHYRVVRDFLSRSFYTSTGKVWISPALVRYVAKVYSMTMGGQIARIFGLSPMIQSFIQSVFCLFFVGKMTDNDIAQDFTKSHARSLGMYDDSSLTQIFAFVEDTLGKKVPESLDEVCQVVDAYGHDHMQQGGVSRMTRAVLNTKFMSLAPDGQTSMIALEYPPYFLLLILMVLSHEKVGLSFTMKTLKLDREGTEVMEQMMRSPLFLDSI